ATCILFGDGAAAILLEAQDQPGKNSDRGILHVNLHSDGQYTDWLKTSGGVSATQTAGTLSMAGKEIYRHAVTKMPEAVEEGMRRLGLPLSAIDWVVPRQANLRILHGVGQKLGLPESKLIATVQDHANPSAASIPLALHAACADGR